MNKNNKFSILFSYLLVVFIIVTGLVSCSSSKVLIKDEKIQDMLAKEEISYDYTLENGLVINKIFDKNEINGYTIESTESFCLYLVDKLNLENKGIVYETYNNSYESYLKIKQDETNNCNISICDTRKNYDLFESENTINITEKNYFLNVFFSNAMAQYTSILPSFTFIYVDSGEYMFPNQMYVDILCGDFYINIVGNIDYELLGIFGIEQEEYEENKLNFVFPMKKIIIDKEIDKNKLLQFINEHEEMKVGKYTSDVSTNHTYVIFDFLPLINLYKSNEEQLICIDNEKHALYGFDFIDDGFFIPSKSSNFETRGAGIIIYFNNSVCYSITDDIFDVIPYICCD